MKTNAGVLLSLHGRSMLELSTGLYRKMSESDFIQKVLETFVTRIILMGVGLATTVMVARILGPEGRGLYVIATTIGAIGVQFGNFGLHASNTYYVAHDRELLPALVGNTIVVSFVFGGAAASLAWIIFSVWPQIAPLHGRLLVLSLIWVPLGLAYLLLQNLLLGIQEVHSYNKIEMVTRILVVILMSLVILVRAVTVEMIFITGLIGLVISFLWVFRELQSCIYKAPLPSFALFKRNICYGLKAYIAAFFAFLVIRVDLLMIQYMLGAEETGYYSVAVNMADMVYMFPVIIGTILFPKLSAMINRRERWKFTKRVAVVVGLMMVIIVGFTALLAGHIIRLLFGKSFLPAVSALIWLMPGTIMLSLTSIFSCYIASENIPLILVFLYFLMALLNIGMNWYLLPIFGIVGASIASTVSYSLIFVGILLIGMSIYSKRN